MSTTEDRTRGELRDGYAEIGDQRLQYVEARLADDQGGYDGGGAVVLRTIS
jgi:hypothetical protein